MAEEATYIGIVGLYVFSEDNLDMYRLSGSKVVYQEFSPEKLGIIASELFKDNGVRFENGVYYVRGNVCDIDYDSSNERIFTKEELLNFHKSRLEIIIDSMKSK
tara:strand:- start:188 stop:499 length:312 start_codon:yes stop_codon:yes gene_type:complete